MVFLYSLLMLLLSGTKLVVQRRAAALGRAYSRLAVDVQKRLRETVYRQGNSSKSDPCQSAKVQFELGALVARRDAVEAKHFAWQGRAERLARWVDRLRSWKGKKLPYTVGAVDLWLVLSAVDALGVGQFVSARQMFDVVATWFTQ